MYSLPVNGGEDDPHMHYFDSLLVRKKGNKPGSISTNLRHDQNGNPILKSTLVVGGGYEKKKH